MKCVPLLFAATVALVQRPGSLEPGEVHATTNAPLKDETAAKADLAK